MIKYILKRVAIGLATLFILTTVVFVLMKSLPGGPFDSERVTDPRVIEIMERAYNLDKPYHIQYLLYLRDLLQGNLGESFKKSGGPNGILYREGLFPFVDMVAGSRRLCHVVRIGNFLSILCSIFGVLVGFYLTFTGIVTAVGERIVIESR